MIDTMIKLTPEIAAKLREPFAPESVKWRIGNMVYNKTSQERGIRKDNARKGPENNDKGEAVVLAYLDTKLVKNRLDAVVGPDGWEFDWEVATFTGAEVMTAKGRLNVLGVIRCDLGEAGNNEKSKGAVRDSLKRSAFLFGVGDYLADLTDVRASCTFRYGSWQLDKEELPRLAKLLPAPGSRVATPEMVNILCAWYGEQFREKFHALDYESAMKQILAATPPPKKNGGK